MYRQTEFVGMCCSRTPAGEEIIALTDMKTTPDSVKITAERCDSVLGEVVNLRAKNEPLKTEGKRLALRDLADERAVLDQHGRRADLETHGPAEPRAEDVPKKKTRDIQVEHIRRAHRLQQRGHVQSEG